MKEIPIIFSTDMVKGILDGTKNLTFRVIPNKYGICPECWSKAIPHSIEKSVFVDIETQQPVPYLKPIYCEHNDRTAGRLFCPYGQVGDRLYAKETHYRYGGWALTGKLTPTSKPEWEFEPMSNDVRYYDNPPERVCRNRRSIGWWKRPSIFMPRWASRIMLERTEPAYVKRSLEITEEEAKLCGFVSLEDYCDYWNYLNKKRGFPFEDNIWCWGVPFGAMSYRGK